MAVPIDIKIKGDKELIAALNELPIAIQRKILRKAMGKAAKPIIRLARSKAPKKSGTLKKSIGHKVRTYKGSGTTLAVIGARSGVFGAYRGSSRPVVPFYTSHLVERGHRIVVGGKITKEGRRTQTDHTGKVVGEVAPRPFLKPAYEAGKEESLEAIRQTIIEGIAVETAKLKAKTGA